MTNNEVIDLIRDAGFGLLATTVGNQPRVRPMMPYLTDDNQLIFALLGRSRTIAEVKENHLVEICFVDRKMCYCRVTGVAKITESSEKKELLWNTVPMLKQYFGGVEDPNFNLMEIDIKDVEAMAPHDREPQKISLN